MEEVFGKINDNAPAYRTIHMRHGFVLAAILLLAAGLGLWMFRGTVQVTLTGDGVYVPGKTSVTVHYPRTGIIVNISCTENSFVNAGDVLMEIYVCAEEDNYPDIQRMREEAVSICADTSGYITEIKAKPWDRVDVTTDLLRMRTKKDASDPYQVMCCMKEKKLGAIEPGKTRVKFEPNDDDTSDWIWGTVAEKPFTVREDYQLTYLVGSGQLSEFLMDGEYEKEMLIIELDRTEDGKICYANSGKEYSLSVYEEGKVTFILDELHPYEKIFLAGKR